MHVVYCSECWAENSPADRFCTACGSPLEDEATYVEKLMRALSHPEPQTPVRAAWLLGELRASVAAEALMDVVKTTSDPYLQEAAVEALGKIGDERAVPLLVDVAEGRGYVKVRLAAVEALGRFMDTPAARDCLNKLALTDTSVGRRARDLLKPAASTSERR